MATTVIGLPSKRLKLHLPQPYLKKKNLKVKPDVLLKMFLKEEIYQIFKAEQNFYDEWYQTDCRFTIWDTWFGECGYYKKVSIDSLIILKERQIDCNFPGSISTAMTF